MGRRDVQEGGDICTLVAESQCCMAVSSSVKWEQECLSHRIWQEDQMTQQLVCWLVFSSHLSYLSILLLSQPCDFDCGTGMDGFNESSTASFE